MPQEEKSYSFKESLRKFIMGFQLISSLALGIFIIAVLYFAVKYFSAPLYTQDQITEAQKIGNWQFPDSNFVLKNFETISLEDKDIGAVAIKDKQSGNTLAVFDIPFSQDEVLKTKDNIQKKLLEKYGLGNYYLKSSGNKTGRIGQEFAYSAVGWNNSNGNSTGIIGSLDCLKNQQNGSNIVAVIINSPAKYSEERALEFVGTLKCPAGSESGGGDTGLSDKIDTDGDGLPDKVENMLGADPYKIDTDGDRYNDFEEIQSGHNPMVPRLWGDEYTLEEFAKVKKDIKYISIDIYDKLFGGN